MNNPHPRPPAAQLPRPQLAAVTSCESCGRTIKRGRGGPVPRWCPECRADRNRAAASARRKASAPRLGTSSRVAGTRNGRADWQLPAEDHLAMRCARLRLANTNATNALRAGLASGSSQALMRAATTALEALESVPVGR